MNKIAKGLLIGGGIIVATEILDVCSKAAMLWSVKKFDEDTYDDMVDVYEDDSVNVGVYGNAKCKAIAKLSKICDESFEAICEKLS